MSVPVEGVGPQVNKFDHVSSDDHQMSVARGGAYDRLGSYAHLPPVDRMTDGQMPVKTLPSRNSVFGR